jgi:hypothetical protein
MRCLFLLGLVVTAACSREEPPICISVACETQTSVERLVSMAPRDVGKLVYEVCRNDECAKNRLVWHGTEFVCFENNNALSSRANALTWCRLTGDWQALKSAGPTSPVPFDFRFVGLARGSVSDVKDGDRYTFTLSREDTGETLVRANGVVTYETLEPAGPECQQCKVAQIR